MKVSAHDLRALILRALPEEPSAYGGRMEPRHVYFPPSHIKALRPDAMVVIGIRGSGKSFWWSALQEPPIRTMIAQIDRSIQIEERTEVHIGFGQVSRIENYPDKDTIRSLLRAGKSPRMLWKTVAVWNLLSDRLDPMRGWQARIDWVEEHPEEIARHLEEKDRELQRKGAWALILFDAMEQAAEDRETMYDLIRGLLQIALELRPTQRIRLKCFLRPDQFDESRVATFPDASKVIASRVSLNWTRPDLYGLLWQYLANAENADEFREWAEQKAKIRWDLIRVNGQIIYQWPRKMREEEESHRSLFHQIAGPWMGRDPKRGFPYTWLPGHLADAHGRTSPRSFLIALRAAAEDTEKRYPDHRFALHYESIKRGVQRASQIRVDELREDYPWLEDLMRPLRGLVVPCDFQEINRRWQEQNVVEALKQKKMLPPSIEKGEEGLRKDLEAMGIFLRMEDGRVNIPDVFRIGYGLGRRGGVKPIREA